MSVVPGGPVDEGAFARAESALPTRWPLHGGPRSAALPAPHCRSRLVDGAWGGWGRRAGRQRAFHLGDPRGEVKTKTSSDRPWDNSSNLRRARGTSHDARSARHGPALSTSLLSVHLSSGVLSKHRRCRSVPGSLTSTLPRGTLATQYFALRWSHLCRGIRGRVRELAARRNHAHSCFLPPFCSRPPYAPRSGRVPVLLQRDG